MIEIWDGYLNKFVTVKEGGAGSGRYPAGSSGQSEEDGAAKEPLSAKSADTFKSAISAPIVNAQISTLGGAENATLMFTVGLDARETFANGIFENGRYIKGHIDKNNKVEVFVNNVHTGERNDPRSPRVPNLRAKTCKDFDSAVKYVSDYVNKIK